MTTTFTFPGTDLTVHRMGYGAMQLSGPNIYGPPKDENEAIKVLRTAIENGIDHIDTSDFYGPHYTNQIIAKALHPYRDNLVIVTKLGCVRGADASWNRAFTPQDLRNGVHDNLRNLKLETLDIVNLRAGSVHGPHEEPLEEQLSELIKLQKQGLIRHIGLSTVTAKQIIDAQKMTEIVCIQNMYNIVNRADETLIDDLAKQGIAYVPYFPLGGFEPIQTSALDAIAKRTGHTSMQLALAWLLHRAPNILLIPGTSSTAHLKQNIAAASISLDAQTQAELDALNLTATARGA